MQRVKATFRVRVWRKNKRIGGWVVKVKATPSNLRKRAVAKVLATLPPDITEDDVYAELLIK
jgi:hypothetical protein